MVTSVDRSDRRDLRADLSVGQKLAVGFGLAGLVSLLLVLSTFMAVRQLDQANSGEDTAIQQVRAASALQHWTAEMRAEQHSYVSTGGETRQSFESALVEFESALEEMRSGSSSPTTKALVAKIAIGYQSFLVIDQFIWEAVLVGDIELANNYLIGPAAFNFGFLATDTDLYNDEALIFQDETILEFSEKRDQIHVVTAALGVLALVLLAGTSRLITQIISARLFEVQTAAVRASAGNLEVAAPVGGRDEIGTLAQAFNTMLAQLRMRETKLIREHERSELGRKIDEALEMVDDEPGVHNFVSRALKEIAPLHSAELLLADNSRGNFTQVAVSGPNANGPGCQVPSPHSCPAVRAARKMDFDDSEALDSCLHLNGRASGACSATCVPVSFMGRSVGVLHTVGLQGEPTEEGVAVGLETLARLTGGRLGVIRSTAKTEHRASTDGLTGLLNRTSFEEKARAMLAAGEQYTLVMADLDHFKMLNDSYGHAAGDQALRTFSDVLQKTVRDGDLVCRWGGEEFTFALLNSSSEDATTMLDRLRLELSGRISTTDTRPFTASFGYIDATACESFDVAIRLADGALYEAKDAGRDRAVAAFPSKESASEWDQGVEEPGSVSSGSAEAV